MDLDTASAHQHGTRFTERLDSRYNTERRERGTSDNIADRNIPELEDSISTINMDSDMKTDRDESNKAVWISTTDKPCLHRMSTCCFWSK